VLIFYAVYSLSEWEKEKNVLGREKKLHYKSKAVFSDVQGSFDAHVCTGISFFAPGEDSFLLLIGHREDINLNGKTGILGSRN
jgi:hypothetical protein